MNDILHRTLTNQIDGARTWHDLDSIWRLHAHDMTPDLRALHAQKVEDLKKGGRNATG